MKTKLGVLLGSLWIGATSLAAGAPLDLLPPPFGPGETLRYEIKWGLIKGGELSLEVSKSSHDPVLDASLASLEPVLDHDSYWRFRGTARSARWISTFYRVEDEIDGWVDSERFLPRFLEIRVAESNERGRRWVLYDHDEGVAHYRRRREFHRKRGPDSIDREDPMESGAHDALSSLFLLRRTELVAGAELTIPVHENGKNRLARIRVGEPEWVRVPVGEHEAWPLEIRAEIEGKLASKKAIRLWLGTGPRRLPLRFEIDLAWGDLTGTLVEESPPVAPRGNRLSGLDVEVLRPLEGGRVELP